MSDQGQWGAPQPGYVPPQPGWQQPAPPPVKKKHTARNVILGITGLIVLIVIIASVANGGSKKTNTASSVTTTSATGTSAAQAAATTTSAKAPPPAAAHVGSSIALKGNDKNETVTVTLMQVKDNAPPADQFSQPDAGKKLYSAQFKLDVTGSVPYNDSPSNGAVVIDSASQQYESSFDDSAAGPAFPGGTKIAPGGSALGWITFQVPTSATITAIQFGLDSGFGGTGEWKIP